MKASQVLASVGWVIVVAVLQGCSTPPSERPDYEEIQKNADDTFEDLLREEDRDRGNN